MGYPGHHLVRVQPPDAFAQWVECRYHSSGYIFIRRLCLRYFPHKGSGKDMEDMEGDRRYGCKTMPIVWGLNATKVLLQYGSSLLPAYW